MIHVVKVGWMEASDNSRIRYVLDKALQGVEYQIFDRVEDFCMMLRDCGSFPGRVLFAVSLPANGICLDCQILIRYLIDHRDCLEGAIGGVLVDGKGELFTKMLGRQLVFAANAAGCTFPGRAFVEATGDLRNFDVISSVTGKGNYEAYVDAVIRLAYLVDEFTMPEDEELKILMVHASNRQTSNTTLLWEMIREPLGSRAEIREVSLRNGTMVDCRGCSYETCVHFGEQGDCLYGGVMTETVYPAILECNALMMVCPNYNDAVSANITAFFNRLTALFRTNDFSQKRLYALVVSGYSGGDIVAEQILGAMCFNKNFILPGKFAMIETANAPGSILEIPGIKERAAEMAERIR